ncbi:MAG: hypothetical protein ACRDRU_00975 [Pseudonocardiaceae bacterium]
MARRLLPAQVEKHPKKTGRSRLRSEQGTNFLSYASVTSAAASNVFARASSPLGSGSYWTNGAASLLICSQSSRTCDAFSWLVRAAEGIPRDAINILGLAADYAGKRKIRAAEVQKAARTYYLQNKKGTIENQAAGEVWDTLQWDVVHQQRSRTFLLQRTRENLDTAMLDLYDARLIHLLKPGLVSSSKPDMVYDGYAVDYDCYVKALKEMEMDAAWQASGHPWTFRGDEAFLPDRFDESVIFMYSPTPPHNKQRRGR